MNNKIERLLVVGLGSIGQRHIRIAKDLLPELQIAVLRHQKCDSESDKDILKCFTNIDDAISFQPQAAVIANPATHHIDIAMKLAKAGVHLLIEKPISHESNGVTKLIELCNENNLVLQVGYNLRFLPSLQKFRGLLQTGVIGRQLSVRAEMGQYLPSWRPNTDYRKGVSARKELGGGVLLELSHEIDYLMWLFGNVEWIESSISIQSDLDINVEDTAHLIMGFAEDNIGKRLVANLSLDFIRHDTTRICTVIGEKGTLRWDAVAGIIELFEQDSNCWQEIYRHIAKRDDSYFAEWQNFLASIEGAESPFVNGEDALAVLSIIETIIEESTNINFRRARV